MRIRIGDGPSGWIDAEYRKSGILHVHEDEMIKRFLLLATAVFIGSVSSVCSIFAEPDSTNREPVAGKFKSRLGQVVDDFTLASHRGRPFSLTDFKDKRAVAIVFLGTECPLAKLYGSRLSELQAEFSDRGLAILGINSNTQDSMTEITAYVARHNVTFPVLKDVGNRVADAMGAKRTPEVFLLDSRRKVVYHGRIDDQYGVGFAREKVTRRELAEAIRELLGGRPITQPETEVVGCLIGRAKDVPPTGDVTYCNQIVRILNERCVECHRAGEVAPFTLTSYEDTIGWEDTILEVIADNRMPPWFANPKHGRFSNDARLSEEEKRLLRTWVANGMPEGDRADLPPQPEFAKGWRMPEPDEVFYMDDEPFHVRSDGVIDYQYYLVDPQWTEDRYIWAAEARPDNPRVVHHIIAYLMMPGQRNHNFERGTMLAAYAPGSPPRVLRDGVAVHAPAGSKILFEMHYTPNGSKQVDRSYVGFKYMDKADVKKKLRGRMAIETDFLIPPNASDHVVTAEYRSTRDELLLQMSPHMHLRGKSFRYEAHYPNGETEVLLDVPNYDFNWQLAYRLLEPKLIPKGTKIVCTGTFDNSESNLVNPDPDASVGWGEQSWEEMMIGFFEVIPADRPNSRVGVRNMKIDPSGEWQWQRPTGRRSIKESLSLEVYQDKVEGTLESGGEYYPIRSASLDGDRIRFEVTVNQNGQDLTLDFDAKVYANQLKGEVSLGIGFLGKSFEVPWKAERLDDEEVSEESFDGEVQ